MNLGREMDALVAEKVMQREPQKIHIATRDAGQSAAAVEDPVNGPFYSHNQIRDWIEETPGYELGVWLKYPPYSTNFTAAMEVRDVIASKLFSVRYAFTEELHRVISKELDMAKGELLAHSAVILRVKPHHICLAALKALENDLTGELEVK